MKIFAVDSSSRTASCAVAEDGTVLGLITLDIGLTHSETLAPAAEKLLSLCSLSLADIDIFAAAVGPGSFTGLRIGTAFIKGLAFGRKAVCCAVSTLEGLSRNVTGNVLCALDARRNEFYAAAFSSSRRLTPDAAVDADGLFDICRRFDGPFVIVGDGAEKCLDMLAAGFSCSAAPPNLRYQSAASVALVAAEMYAHNDTVAADCLCPVYLRLSQAERELAAKNGRDSK